MSLFDKKNEWNGIEDVVMKPMKIFTLIFAQIKAVALAEMLQQKWKWITIYFSTMAT